MATADLWVHGLLTAGAWAAGGYAAVRYVIPQIEAMLTDVLKYAKAVSAFAALLTVWVYVVAAKGVVAQISAIGGTGPNYITVINPALELLNGFVPYMEWFVVGIGLVIIAERIKLR